MNTIRVRPKPPTISLYQVPTRGPADSFQQHIDAVVEAAKVCRGHVVLEDSGTPHIRTYTGTQHLVAYPGDWFDETGRVYADSDIDEKFTVEKDA